MFESFLTHFSRTPVILIWVLLALAAFVGSLLTSAPYGRHFRDGWGPAISNSLGWVLMELPALLLVPVSFWLSQSTNIVHVILATMWSVHYIHRTLIFPFRLRTKGKQMPLSVVLMAVGFNFINGCFVSTVFFMDLQMSGSLVLLGILLFIIGMIINISSDYHLINLRNANQGYAIPRGRWFEMISCPNHFGEILEWTGFALVANVTGPWLFVIWTAANLIPRALSHHHWYHENFPNYPKQRKAIFPYLL